MRILELPSDMAIYRVEVICFEKTSEEKDLLLIKVASWIRRKIDPLETIVNFDGITSLKFVTTMNRRSLAGWVEDALNSIQPYYTSYTLETFDL
jgi:hypothetical protein